MANEDLLLGFGDFGNEGRGGAAMAVQLLQQPAMRFAQFRVSGVRLKPQELISFLRVHAARTRRRALTPQSISLEVMTPSGLRAVEISFKEA